MSRLTIIIERGAEYRRSPALGRVEAIGKQSLPWPPGQRHC